MREKRMSKLKMAGFTVVALHFFPAYAHATTEVIGNPLLDGVLSTVIYSLLGIVMAVLSFKMIDLITPGDLARDIAHNNIALAILTGFSMLGICIIIASVLSS